MHAWRVNKEVKEAPGSFVWLKRILVMVNVLADLHAWEEIVQIFEIHPEKTIVFGLDLELFLQLGGPAIRLVTPSSLPLEGTPWVSELTEIDSVAILVLNSLSRDDTVGVLSNQALGLQVLNLGFVVGVAS